MTIVKGIGIMKKRCKMIIALLSAAMVLTACAKNTSDTDSNKANDTKTQDTSKDAAQDDTETEKTKEYQAKLDMIEPSAYGDASGLSLEEGAYISIIGKGTNDDFWVQVKKGAEQAGKDINEQLGYKGKKAVKVVYSGHLIRTMWMSRLIFWMRSYPVIRQLWQFLLQTPKHAKCSSIKPVGMGHQL